MRMYVLPAIGEKPLNDISADDVAKIAESIWNMPETVNRCLRFTRQVFNRAKAKGFTTIDNPAYRSGALKYLLPQQRHLAQNRGAVSVEALPEFFKVMYDRFHDSGSGRCFLFCVLTATRSGTARAARGEQIDLENAEWLIPPAQLKTSENGSLLVPLAPEVVRLLKSWGPKKKETLQKKLS